MDLAITYTQRGSFPHKFIWETPGPPSIHTSTLLPPPRLLQRLGRRDGFKNLPHVISVLPPVTSKDWSRTLWPPPWQRLPTRNYKTSVCQNSKQSGGQKNSCPPSKNTSCNAKPCPKRLATNYFFILNILPKIQAPKMSKNFGESWCYFHKTNLVLPSSETTYSWIGRPVQAHTKLICRETERATTDLNIRMKSFRQGASNGAG